MTAPRDSRTAALAPIAAYALWAFLIAVAAPLALTAGMADWEGIEPGLMPGLMVFEVALVLIGLAMAIAWTSVRRSPPDASGVLVRFLLVAVWLSLMSVAVAIRPWLAGGVPLGAGILSATLLVALGVTAARRSKRELTVIKVVLLAGLGLILATERKAEVHLVLAVNGVLVASGLIAVKVVTTLVRHADDVQVRAQEEVARARAAWAEHDDDAQRLAEARRVEAIGRLADGVAHVVNNALTVVLGNVAVLRQQATPGSETQAMLDDAATAADAARAAVHRLGLLGGPEAVRGVASVAAIVQRTIARLVRDAPNGVKISQQFLMDGDVGMNGEALEAVLVSLLQNAREATPAGGQVELIVGPGRGLTLAIEIRDTGAGMELDVLERAREPFFTTKPHGAGLGLGLTAAYASVGAVGGTIELWSQPGAGTTVRVELPRVATA